MSYSEADISENVRRLAEVANILSDVGLVVIISCVSASRSDRENAKKIIGEDKFMEVFLDADIEECIANDKNGVYDSENISEQKDYIYEKSLYPHFVISSQYDEIYLLS